MPVRTLPRWIAASLVSLLLVACGTPSRLQTPAASSLHAREAGPLRWSVNLHAKDVGHDVARARVALRRIRELGATMVRTDFDWDQLEPQPGIWDPEKLAFYDAYVNEARAQGLEVICILFQAPDWAETRRAQGDLPGFLEAFRGYSQKVAERYGDRLHYYQYWNEPNRLPFETIPREQMWRILLAGDQGVRAGDASGHLGMVNFTTDALNGPRWASEATYYLRQLNVTEPRHTLRLIGVDPYPGTWNLNGRTAWKAVDELSAMLTDPQSPCYGLDGAVMETGYSSYFSLKGRDPEEVSEWKQESDQADWFAQALPELKRKLQAFNASQPNRMRFINLYELYDSRSWLPIHPEDHFGLYRHDETPKPAVEVVRTILKGR